MTAPAGTAAPGGRPVTVFYSYAREDEALRDELAEHLRILERRGLIASWHDRRIAPGEAWAGAIDQALETADLVLLLVSSDFVASEYIVDVELARAMARHAAQACEVVPVIVRPVDLDPEDADALPFLRLQGLPPDLRPVTSWPNRDEAWTQVAKGLRATVKRLHARWAGQAPALAPVRPVPPPAAVPGPAAVAVPVPVRRGPVPMPSAGDRPVVPAGVAPGPASRPAAMSPRPEAPPARVVPPAPAPAPAPAVADPLIDRVLDRATAALEAAATARGDTLDADDRARLRRDADRLVDTPDPRRVLWVDDRPGHNRAERAALAALQIEVVAVTSTAEALDRVAAADARGEPFDLVISDWSRPWEGRAAALQLVEALRDVAPRLPVVVYHAVRDEAQRVERAARLAAAGVAGEAVRPDELLRQVRTVLAA